MPRPVDPNRLTFIDIVTSSHNHTDHLDAETLLAVLRNSKGVMLAGPEANRQFISDRLGIDPERIMPLDDNRTWEACGFRITGVPAAHDELERRG